MSKIWWQILHPLQWSFWYIKGRSREKEKEAM